MVDVARKAGVSVGTVSNVARGTAPVADETRERVQRAMRELGYRHNEVARALRRAATQTLGVVMPDPLNPFYAAVAQHVERRARRRAIVRFISARCAGEGPFRFTSASAAAGCARSLAAGGGGASASTSA